LTKFNESEADDASISDKDIWWCEFRRQFDLWRRMKMEWKSW